MVGIHASFTSKKKRSWVMQVRNEEWVEIWEDSPWIDSYSSHQPCVFPAFPIPPILLDCFRQERSLDSSLWVLYLEGLGYIKSSIDRTLFLSLLIVISFCFVLLSFLFSSSFFSHFSGWSNSIFLKFYPSSSLYLSFSTVNMQLVKFTLPLALAVLASSAPLPSSNVSSSSLCLP